MKSFKALLILQLLIQFTYLSSEELNSNILIQCIKTGENIINTDSAQSLQAVGKCLTSYVETLEIKIQNNQNKPELPNSLSSEDTGSNDNVYYGNGSGSGDNGKDNTGIGMNTLKSLASGSRNVAVGHDSLTSNTDGTYNTGVGNETLYNNTLGSYNSAHGYGSLFSNTSGSNNTAVGGRALIFNQTGDGNATLGYRSLYANIAGSNNTALGTQSCQSILGSGNVCIGSGSGSNYEGSNMLFISNTADTNLIKGNFQTGFLEIGDIQNQNGGLLVKGNLGLQLQSATEYKISLSSPQSLNLNLAFTLPNSYGTSGQVLTTDGSGNLYWSTEESITVTDNDTTNQSLTIDNGIINLTDSSSQTLSVDITETVTEIANKVDLLSKTKLSNVEETSTSNQKAISNNISQIASLANDLSDMKYSNTLNNAMMRSEYSIGIASSVALSQISLAEEGFSIGIGYGSFNSEKEGAFGFGYGGKLENGNRFKLKASFNDEVKGAGFSLHFN